MRADIQRVREILASLPDLKGQPIEHMRAAMDQMGRSLNLPRGVTARLMEPDAPPGQWIEPPEAVEQTAMLYLHGGGYVMGSPMSHRQQAGYISRAARAPVLLLEYRLAPENPFPAALEDSVKAYRWLVGQGIPPTRIAIAGDSAGGGLTVATLAALRDAGEPVPAAGMCISPWVDLTCSAETYTTKAETDPVVIGEEVRRFAGAYLAGKDPKTPLASPLFADLHGLPPLLVQVGSEEILLDDSIGLDRQVRKASGTCTLEVWDQMIHVWHAFAPILDEAKKAVARIAEFFHDHVR